MKFTSLSIFFFLLSLGYAQAQGLEGIIVELYYQTDAADELNALENGSVVPLPAGSKVYRVFVDMADGYKFSRLYGTATHPLTVNATSDFYNDPSYGVTVNPATISANNIRKFTALIDSWFATGGISNGKVGVLKIEDTDGSVGNQQNVLANNPGGCYGVPINGINAQDGMTPNSPTTYVIPNSLGLGGALDALDQSADNSVVIANGSIVSLGGIVGPTATNRVIIGQFTVNGDISFALNVQLINTVTGAVENYVASNPMAGELTHPTLTSSSTFGVTPTFTAVGPYCSGATIPVLPSTSTNGITGTWNPAIDNTANTTYTFTPTSGQCAATASMTITITPKVTPIFNAIGPFCGSANLPALPGTSVNGVAGTWSPATITSASTQYVFTPTPSVCATSTSKEIIVNPDVSVSVSPTDAATCSGSSITLNASGPPNGGNILTNSTQNNLAIPDNGLNGEGTPGTAGQNYSSSALTVSGVCPNVISASTYIDVNVNLNHTFVGDLVIYLLSPNGTNLLLSSLNGGSGDNYVSTHFITTATTNITAGIAPFTNNYLPEGGFSTLIGSPINGTWSLFVGDENAGDTGSLINWSISFQAPTVSYSWSPTTGLSSTNTASTVASPTATTTYTVTATNSCGCSGTASSTITVQVPTANMVSPTTNPALVCAGSSAQLNFSGTPSAYLNYTLNGLNGSHSINISGSAIITPSSLGLGLTWPSSTSLIFTSVSTGNGATGCVTPLNIVVSVRPQPTITSFTVPTSVCTGSTATVNVSATPNTTIVFSFNGTGTVLNVGASGVASWTSPALTANATINFTSIANTTAPLCTHVPFTSNNTITVTGSVAPSFSPMGPFCYGDTPNILSSTSANGVTGTWSPAVISTTTLGTTNYTFTPLSTGCGSTPVVLPVTVNERPLVFAQGTNPTCSSLCNGSAVADVTGGSAPYVYSWSNGGTTATLSNLCEGTYDVSVTDANGCQSQDFTPVSGCFQIQSISVDACGAGAEEGINEMFFIQIGNSPLNLYSATITWPSNSFTNFNCSNAAFIASANAGITAGGVILPIPASGVLPANANVVIMTSNTTNLSPSTFATITDTLFMAFHCASVVQAYFANGGANGARTLTMSFGAGCSDQVTYLTSSVPNSDGAYVNYSQAGTPTYTDYNCSANSAIQNNSVILDAPNAVIPIFNPVGPFCSGSLIPALPTTSTNVPAITGAWTPAINNTTTTTYTFIPNPTNQCANNAQLTITINDILDFGNLQFPSTASICAGGSFNAFGQLFNTGVIETALPGVAAGVTVQLGYNTSNTNPSSWTNWTNASFNTQAGNNDEYMGTISNLSTGTYYYTFRYRINNCDWQYGGFSSTGGGFWGGTNVSGVLTVVAPPSAGNDGSIALCTNANPVNLFNVLSGSPASTGTWSGPSSLSNGNLGTFNPSVNTGGQYTYTVSGIVCPDDVAVVSVNLNTTPSATITNLTGTSQLGCSVQSISLLANGGTSYSWSGGLGNTAAVSIQQPDTYTVTVTNGNGCANTASITITGNGETLPTATISGILSPICYGETATFQLVGTPNWLVQFALNGIPATVSLDASGAGQIIIYNATYSQTVQLISMTDGICSLALNNSASIAVYPNLTATISTISPICAGTNAITDFTGPPNGVVTFTHNGNLLTITLNGAGSAQYTIEDINQTNQLELVSVTNGLCTNSVTGSVSIDVLFDASCGFQEGCIDPLACNYEAAAVINNGTCTYPGCTDPLAGNYDAVAGCDDGSCVFAQGCTDALACNYDANAVVNDGSCTYPGCTNPSALNFNAQAGCDDGSCIYPSGCTDITACNYDAAAITDDGSCTYPGCTNPSALNYNAQAGCDDGSCIYPSGCTDVTACNYDAAAVTDDGTCTYPGCTDPSALNYNSSAGCEDFSCYYSGIPGCLDPMACNFNSQATYDDFSCLYPGCLDGGACNYNSNAGCDDGSCIYPGCTEFGACNYDANAGCSNGSCQYPGCLDPIAINYNPSAGCDDGSCTYSGITGCTDPTACNYNSQANYEDFSCVYPGCIDGSACNYNPIAGCDDGSCTYPGCLDPLAQNYNSLAGCDDGSCVFAQGCTDVQACNYDANAVTDDGSCTYPGCLDPLALNYNVQAGCDDGSCVFAQGCTDALACNYDANAAINDGSCTYPGCTDPTACNYNATAGCDDGSCAASGCTDANACNYDDNAACDDGSCAYLDGEISGPQLVFTLQEDVFEFPCDIGCAYQWSVSDIAGTADAAGIILGADDDCEATIAWGNQLGIATVNVAVTCVNGCSNAYSFDVQLDVDTTNSVQETSLKSMLLFPNPTTDHVTLSVSPSLLGSVMRVYGLIGNLIVETTVTHLEIDLTTAAWASGIYRVVLEKDGMRVNEMLVKP